MKHRERVLKAINHEEPDRVPIDLGSTTNSSILKEAYDELRNYLGMDSTYSGLISRMMWVEDVDDDVVVGGSS